MRHLGINEGNGAIPYARAVVLSPLPRQDGCYESLALITTQPSRIVLTLEEFLAGVLIEQGLVCNWRLQVVNQ